MRRGPHQTQWRLSASSIERSKVVHTGGNKQGPHEGKSGACNMDTSFLSSLHCVSTDHAAHA